MISQKFHSARLEKPHIMKKTDHKVISVSSEELLSMRAFYEQEYLATKTKLQHLSSMLNKLGGLPVEVPEVEAAEPVLAPKTSTVSTAKSKLSGDQEIARRKRKKKRGPKPTWSKFILDRLKAADRPMTYNELFRDAMVLKNKAPEEYNATKASVLNSAFRLRTVANKIDTLGEEGKKEKFIVLTKWMDDKGALVSPYNHKLEELKHLKESAE